MTCSVVVSAFWTKISRCCVKKNYNDASDDVPDVKIPKHFPPREGPFLMFWKIGRLLQASLLYRARNWHWQLTRGSLIRLVGTNLQGFTTRGEITKNWFQKVIFTIGLPVNGIHCIQWCYLFYKKNPTKKWRTCSKNSNLSCLSSHLDFFLIVF